MTFFFRHLTRSAAVTPRFPDDLADLLTRTQDDPVAAAAFEDAEVRAHLMFWQPFGTTAGSANQQWRRRWERAAVRF